MGAPIDPLYRLSRRDLASPLWEPVYTDGEIQNGTFTDFSVFLLSINFAPGRAYFITNLWLQAFRGGAALVNRVAFEIRTVGDRQLSATLDSVTGLSVATVEHSWQGECMILPGRLQIEARGVFSALDAGNGVALATHGISVPMGNIGPPLII